MFVLFIYAAYYRKIPWAHAKYLFKNEVCLVKQPTKQTNKKVKCEPLPDKGPRL